jgi:(S)-ureidoglycine aminohydrolase
MKRLVFLLLASCAPVAVAQVDSVASGVYRWQAPAAAGMEAARPVLAGGTTPLAHLEVEAATLAPRTSAHAGEAHDDVEELVIVKTGTLTVTAGGYRQALGPGSVAVIFPGDGHTLENAAAEPATFFVFQYRSRAPVDAARGRKAGGSFLVNWDDVVMRETETGGRRQIFDRATAMFDRFEMHVSTLKEGLSNHAAHTHRAEEFVLVLKGEVQMLIGEAHRKAAVGDLIFLESMIPHALDNIGSGPTAYFAFQWQ